MKLPDQIKLWGDTSFRGDCPSEALEQVTFVNRVRARFPDSYGLILLHPRNEGKRTKLQAMKEKAEGLATGAPDLIIPARVPFLCELKRRDHTKSTISEKQVAYLEAAQNAGAYVCIALGVDSAWNAFEHWKSTL